jgi:hypothetical protein
MTGPQLGLFDKFTKAAVHHPALRWCSVGIDPAGQQGMDEPKPVTVDANDRLPLGVGKQLE